MKDYLKLSEKTEKKFPEGMDLNPTQAETLFAAMVGGIRLSQLANLVKRELIYGKPFDEEAAQEIMDFPSAPVFTDHKTLTQEQAELVHHALGLFTEAGEVLEAVFKHTMEGAELDKSNLAEEIGDVSWYAAGLCRLLGTTFETEMRRNIAKLAKRYPDRYTDEAALNRDLDAERKVVEDDHSHGVEGETR